MRSERDTTRLLDALARVLQILRRPEERLYLRIEAVSAWSPAQHLEHALLALDHALDAITRLQDGSDPAILARGRPAFLGRLVAWTGWIPRGRAQAPDTVHPEDRPRRPILREQAADLELRVARLDPAALPGIAGALPHPLLGPHTAVDWLRFARVHTEHHLAIVDDLDRRRAIGVPDDSVEASVGLEPS